MILKKIQDLFSENILELEKKYLRSVIFGTTRQNRLSLFIPETDVCLKNLFINLLGPKEMISSFEQYLSNNLVYTFKLFPEVCHTR